MTIKNSSETIVYKLVGVIRQPAYLRPVCGFYYLEVLLTIIKKHQLSHASITIKSEKNFVMCVDILILFTSIHVLHYITATLKSKFLMY